MSKAAFKKALAARSVNRTSERRRHERRYIPPSDEQLLSFVVVATGATQPFQRTVIIEALKTPAIKQIWLDRHRELQEHVWRAGK